MRGRGRDVLVRSRIVPDELACPTDSLLPEELSLVSSRARMFGSLFVFAAAIRAIGYPTIFTSAGVHLPYAGDAYYHLRRIWFSVARFPETLPFDRYVSFPDGSQNIWPSTFDWTIAAFIRPFVDPTDQAAVEAIAVWAPVVLGATTAGLIALFAGRAYGEGAGWCAGALYSILPMSFIYSQLGMIDHHVAVALLTTAMLWLVYEVFDDDDSAETCADAIVTPSMGLCVAVGFAMAITIVTWTGSLIHACVLQAALGLRWFWTQDRVEARSRAIEFGVVQAVAAACLAPFSLGTHWQAYSDWSPLVLTHLQPIYFASAAGVVCVVQLLHDRSTFGRSRQRRTASGLAIAGTAGLAVLVVFDPLREAIFSASAWFGDGEILLDLASEMKPIFAPRGILELTFALERFGAGFFVLPFAWLYLAWRAFKTHSRAQWLILFWTLAFAVLTLRQWRFGNTLAVVYVILLSAVAADWFPRLRRRMRLAPVRPALEILVVTSLIVGSAMYMSAFYRPIVQMSVRALSSERHRNLGPLHPTKRIYDEAGRWLAEHSPVTQGYLDALLLPEYGVLSDWSSGHVLRYRSERPMIQDNFGPYVGRGSFELAWAYYAERREASAIEILEGLGVRYVIAGPMGAGSAKGLEPDAMAYQLWTASGSMMPISGGRDGGSLPGLSQHRLVFHAHTLPPNRRLRGLVPAQPFTSLGIWEIVAGAVIEGHAQPGAVIELQLQLRTKSRASHVYSREAVADESGRYRIVVPYSTDTEWSSDVRVTGLYRLTSQRANARLAVFESDVLSGGLVHGPQL